MTVDDPRALTPSESSVLALLLSVEFPGVDELRVQARSAAVVRKCNCGCPSIALEVPNKTPEATGVSERLAPSEAVVAPAQGDGPPGEILLFVDDVVACQREGTTALP